MNPQGLRRAEIIGVSEHRDPGYSAIRLPENSAPSRYGIVAAESILSFRREERHIFFCPPVAVAPDRHASISIVRQEKRDAAGGLLRRNDIKQSVRLWT